MREGKLVKAVGGFFFSRPEDVATNPEDPSQAVFVTTGNGRLYPFDNWGTLYGIEVNFSNLKATSQILYDCDDGGNSQFIDPDFGLRSPDNLDWADNGNIYIQEDRATSTLSLFGRVSGEEASIWEFRPANRQLRRIGQVNRNIELPIGQTDNDQTDLGNWETSGVLDISNLFNALEDEVILAVDIQAHSVRGGDIELLDLVQGGQLVFLMGILGFSTSNNDPLNINNEDYIHVYPNPFSNYFTIESNLSEIRLANIKKGTLI